MADFYFVVGLLAAAAFVGYQFAIVKPKITRDRFGNSEINFWPLTVLGAVLIIIVWPFIGMCLGAYLMIKKFFKVADDAGNR